MFGDPRDVLDFCPKEDLKRVNGSLKQNRKECNMCLIKQCVYNYNDRYRHDEIAIKENDANDNTHTTITTHTVSVGSTEEIAAAFDSVSEENNEISQEDSESNLEDSNEDNESSEESSNEFIYSNGIQTDICVNCYETYPNTSELKEALIFYSMIYEHGHYYPCFPETERILTDRHNIDLKSVNVYELQYRNCKYLDSFASYNTMLECMDMFGLTLNECLTFFIQSVDNGKREKNLSALGFGTGFPEAPLVIYKFLEKFIRYTVRHRMHQRPSARSLEYPEKEQEERYWYNYEDEVKRYHANVELSKKLKEYPNNYKLCYNDFWPLQDIHLVNYMYEKCYFENYEESSNYFLGKFDYKTSVNLETKNILTNFLKKYDDTYIDPKKEDYNYKYVSGRSYGENGIITETYITGIIGSDDDDDGLDRAYFYVKNENIFLYAIRKFTESICIKDEVYQYLKKKYKLPKEILNHIDLMY